MAAPTSAGEHPPKGMDDERTSARGVGPRLIIAAVALAVVAVVAVPVLSRPAAQRPTSPRVALSPDAERPSPPGAWAGGQPHREEHLSPTLECLKPLATPKAAPRPGDWLDRHPEPGQLVADLQAERPPAGWPKGRAFYLATIGPLSEAERRLLERTRELLATWFQRPVEWLEPLPESAVSPAFRRPRANGPQWQTTPILDAVQARRPDDAIAVMAFTAVDLYPDPEWNFVFGEARPDARVGVTSLARLGQADSALALSRTVATGAHELGHMLGLAHCVAFECVMNGSNSLEEADATPLEPCPVCLEKLRVRLDLDVVARAEAMAPAWRDAGFPDPARQLDAARSLWRDAGP
ncbi:MAG: hypothetical protein SFW67_04155 [Myxococcaceae bacterium]|nr:hypothetical protein [Myxococcaceae bacterium]